MGPRKGSSVSRIMEESEFGSVASGMTSPVSSRLGVVSERVDDSAGEG